MNIYLHIYDKNYTFDQCQYFKVIWKGKNLRLRETKKVGLKKWSILKIEKEPNW